MNIEKLFAKFKENWEQLSNHTEGQKENYLKLLLNRVNIDNPHYIKSLPDFYMYDLVKEKVDILFDDIEFECQRCLKSCCYFSEPEYRNKQLGIQFYKEDYELLKTANGDLNGFIIHDHFNTKINFDLQGNMDYGVVDMLKKDDKFQCYYFDGNEKECKIHRYKPLVCLLHPFRFYKHPKDLEIIIYDSCIFIKNNTDLSTKLINSYSYWEFWIALALFLKYVIHYGRDRK